MGREPPQYSAKKRDGIARQNITRQNNTRNSTVQHNVERHNSTCDGSSVQYGMITVQQDMTTHNQQAISLSDHILLERATTGGGSAATR